MILRRSPGVDGTDYINASFINVSILFIRELLTLCNRSSYCILMYIGDITKLLIGNFLCYFDFFNWTTDICNPLDHVLATKTEN